MRNRVFFVCIRHDLGVNFLKVSDLFNVEPHISMDFNEPGICYGEFADYMGKPYGKRMKEMFDNRTHGDIDMSNAYRKLTGKRGFFNQCYLYEDEICNTLTAHADSTIPFNKPVYLSNLRCATLLLPARLRFLRLFTALHLRYECTACYDGASGYTSLRTMAIKIEIIKLYDNNK